MPTFEWSPKPLDVVRNGDARASVPFSEASTAWLFGGTVFGLVVALGIWAGTRLEIPLQTPAMTGAEGSGKHAFKAAIHRLARTPIRVRSKKAWTLILRMRKFSTLPPPHPEPPHRAAHQGPKPRNPTTIRLCWRPRNGWNGRGHGNGASARVRCHAGIRGRGRTR